MPDHSIEPKAEASRSLQLMPNAGHPQPIDLAPGREVA